MKRLTTRSNGRSLRILKAGPARLEGGPATTGPDHRPGRQLALLAPAERKKSEAALRRAHDQLELRVQRRTEELSETIRALEIQVLNCRQAEKAFQESRAELERRRVQERTAELSRTNQALDTEITRRLEAERNRYRVLRNLLEIQEAERGRIARELHDQFGQDLSAMSLALKRIADELPANSALRPRVGQAMVMLGNLMRDAHSLVWNLRPPELDDLGLCSALRRYTSEWVKLSDIPVDFHFRGDSRKRLPSQITTTVYRIAQEALTNVLKHARASRVSVLLEQDHSRVALVIEDNGRGFQVDSTLENAAGVQGRLGLRGMKERAALAGGTFEVESMPGSGTTLFARIPLPPARHNRAYEKEKDPRTAG